MRRWLLFTIILLVCYQQVVRVDLPWYAERWQYHENILARTEQAPFLQRALTVWVAEGAAQVIGGNIPLDVLLAHAVIGVLALAAFLCGCDAYFRTFTDDTRALIGVLLVGLSFNLWTVFYTPVPHYSWVEAALMTWGLVCIRLGGTRAKMTIVLVVAVGALNRNTIAFLPLFYGLTALYQRHIGRELGWIALYGAVFALVTALVYLVQGAGVTFWTPLRLLYYNLDGMRTPSSIQLAMVIPFVYLAMRHYGRAPLALRALMPGVIVYLAFIFIFGAWTETRLIIPVLPILVAFFIRRLPITSSNPARSEA